MRIIGTENTPRNILLILLTAVLIPSISYAAASPDPSISCNPFSVVKDTQCTITVQGTATTENVDQITVYAAGPIAAGADDNTCPNPGPGVQTIPGGSGVWRLVGDVSGLPIRANLNSNADMVIVDFGTPIGGGTVTVNTAGATTLTTDGSDPSGGVAGPINGKWIPIGTAIVANTGPAIVPSFYGLMSCGTEPASTMTAAPPAGFGYENIASFQIIAPVGGEVLSINMVSLLIAGISTSFTPLIVLGVIAASSFAVLKLQLSKKD